MNYLLQWLDGAEVEIVLDQMGGGVWHCPGKLCWDRGGPCSPDAVLKSVLL